MLLYPINNTQEHDCAAESYIGKSEKSDADAVLQVSMSANYKLYEKVRRENTMCEALRRLMKDEIEETIDEAKREASENGRAEGLADGIVKGRIEAQRETSIALSQMGMSLENIAKAVNVDIEQVHNWITLSQAAE